MRRMIVAVVVVVIALGSVAGAAPIVVNFDDLPYSYYLTGSGYAGLTWESGNLGYENNQGRWSTATSLNNYPYSPTHNAINVWGSTMIGIDFPQPVNVLGAYIAGQGTADSWTTGVRVHGYLGLIPVANTGWFNNIDASPDYFAMNLSNVDRIVFESVPVDSGGGWFGMDNLTYEPVPEPATLALLGLSGLLVSKRRRA